MNLHCVLFRTIWCGLVLFLLSFLPLPVEGDIITSEQEYVPGDIIIKYKEDRPSKISRGMRICWARSARKIGSKVEHLKLPPFMTTEQAIEHLKNDPNIAYVEPNYIVRPMGVPNDLYFDRQWALKNTGQRISGSKGTKGADIAACSGWEEETGDSSMVVAVIDTGISWHHPDLAENIWSNPGEVPDNGVDDDANGLVDDVRGWDFVHGDKDPTDSYGHGTHVAGIIGAEGDNNIGIAGVSWDVGLMPLRALNANGVGYHSDILAAMEYAMANNARIINASYGKESYSQLEFDALARAQEAGILVVAAAGNSAADVNAGPFYPAAYHKSRAKGDDRVLHNIIAVAATDNRDQLAEFSNYGATSVDVAAPGWAVYSTVPRPKTIVSWDFERGDIGGWDLAGSWGVTSQDGYDSNYSLTDSPDGDYGNNHNIAATTPVIVTEGNSGLVLKFRIKGNTEPENDRLNVEACVDGRGIGTDVDVDVDGAISRDGWKEATADLGRFDGVKELRIRFWLRTSGSDTHGGYLIDNVTIAAADENPATGEAYKYMQGTSMAAPHVSGLAALLWSQDPSRDYQSVKNAILENVDVLPSLSGKVLTGGRINVAKSLGVSALLEPEPQPEQESESAPEAELVEERVDSSVQSSGGGGGGGCVHDPSAALGLEWLFAAAVLFGLRRVRRFNR
ncbi:MAG: S8 family serine peptidase [Desulfovibrionales bacterium]